MIDSEEHNLNAGNSADFPNITISNDAEDKLIATTINAGDLTDFSEDAASRLIAVINDGNFTDCADI